MTTEEIRELKEFECKDSGKDMYITTSHLILVDKELGLSLATEGYYWDRVKIDISDISPKIIDSKRWCATQLAYHLTIGPTDPKCPNKPLELLLEVFPSEMISVFSNSDGPYVKEAIVKSLRDNYISELAHDMENTFSGRWLFFPNVKLSYYKG